MAEYKITPGEHNSDLRVRSGEVNVNDRLTSFLYELIRDHLPASVVEKLVRDSQDPDVAYTNGWMADDNFKKCWSLENLRPYSAKQNQLDGITKIRHKKDIL
jgi:hypothetical protein